MVIERRRQQQRGFAIVFYASMLIFVTGCVGLAVDVGTIFLIKARLSAAADAAACHGQVRRRVVLRAHPGQRRPCRGR